MSRTPQDVFESHKEAVQTGNFEQLIGNYAEDAVLLTMDRVYRGKDGVDEYFKTITSYTNVVVNFEAVVFADDLVVQQWSADADEVFVPRGVGVFLIRDGLIQRQGEWFEILPKG
jgi:ketosteroid isomerase-like protein